MSLARIKYYANMALAAAVEGNMAQVILSYNAIGPVVAAVETTLTDAGREFTKTELKHGDWPGIGWRFDIADELSVLAITLYPEPNPDFRIHGKTELYWQFQRKEQ